MTKKTFRKTRKDIDTQKQREEKRKYKHNPKFRYVENKISTALKTADVETLMELEDYLE